MVMMKKIRAKKQTILMFPWLGHGHISPFLELAKKLSNTNLFNIYLCSTPANLNSIKKSLTNDHGSQYSIKPIELHLETLPELPPNLHTTNGLPLHLMPTLKEAFDNAISGFSKILETLKPDLLIYDMIQYWAPVVAAGFGIPAVLFITTSATMASNMFHLYLKSDKGIAFPFPKIYYRAYERGHVTGVLESSANGRKDKDRVMECVDKSSEIVLVKSFNEIEGKYSEYLFKMTGKRVVSVGPLVVDPFHAYMKQNGVIQWLDTKTTGSTVFVSFGSEYFLSNDDLQEIALGLEMSNVNFIWVLRFPKCDKTVDVEESLPVGFLERVKDRGLLVKGWAPQAKILQHKNIGGFMSHCGWNSVMEAMQFGVPIIAMPMQLDQPVNARLVAEVGNGVEVLRDGNGRLHREKVAAVVQHVVVSELGEVVREKAKKMSVELREKGDEEIDVVVDELLRLGKCGRDRRDGGRTGLKKAKSDAFVISAYFALEGEA